MRLRRDLYRFPVAYISAVSAAKGAVSQRRMRGPMAQMRKINREYPDSGIHMVLLKDPVEPASLGLSYRRDYQWSHAARIFAEFLREWLGTEEQDVRTLRDITSGA